MGQDLRGHRRLHVSNAWLSKSVVRSLLLLLLILGLGPQAHAQLLPPPPPTRAIAVTSI